MKCNSGIKSYSQNPVRIWILAIALSISYILTFSQARAQQKDSLELLIDAYARSFSIEKANSILSSLHSAGAMEDKLVFSPSSDKNEVQKNVWYYAADFEYSKQQYGKAIDYASKALEFSKKDDDVDFRADILNLLAICNLRICNHDRAASYAEECYKLDLLSGDPSKTSSSLNTLAGIYLKAKRYPEAEGYILKGLEECQKANNPPKMGILLGMASEVYQAMGKSDVAFDYAQKAYDLEKELGREPQKMVRLSQRASALIGLGKFEEARKDLLVAIPYFKSSGNQQSLGISCNKMGGVLYYLNQNEEAARYYAEAADIFVKLGDPYNEMHARKGLYESLIETDGKEAKRQHDIYDRIKDSLYTLASAESLSRYNASMENSSLRAENSSLTAERIRAHRAKYSTLMAGIAILLVVASSIWLVMRHRNRRQKAAMEATLRKLRNDYLNLRNDYNVIVHSQNRPETTQKTNNVSDNAEGFVSKLDKAFLDKLVSYVEENIESCRLGVEDIASHMCLSSGQLNRKVKSITGNTTQNYVLRLRLERAKILLQAEPEATIADVAYRCGFEDAASFSRAFKRVFDATPSQIRE